MAAILQEVDGVLPMIHCSVSMYGTRKGLDVQRGEVWTLTGPAGVNWPYWQLNVGKELVNQPKQQ
jgi:hypothetical protein